MFLTHGGVEVDIIAARGELEGERPDDFVIVNIMGIAENAPEVGELEAGELAGDEVVGFGVAEEGGRGRVVAKDAIEALEIGGKDVVGLDEDAVFARADDGVSFRGMLNGGDIALCVGDKIILRDGGGEFREGIESLASGFTLLGNVTDEMGRLQTVIPLVDMSIGEADVKTVFVDGIFEIWLASVFAGVMTPNAFVGKGKVAVCAGDSKGVTLKEFAGGREPIVVAADETFVVFADGEDGATVLMRVGFAALLVDSAGDFLVKQEIGFDMESFSSGEDFFDDFGVILLINLLLNAESVHVRSSKEIVTVRAETLGEKTAVIGMRATKLKHKFIIAQSYVLVKIDNKDEKPALCGGRALGR